MVIYAKGFVRKKRTHPLTNLSNP